MKKTLLAAVLSAAFLGARSARAQVVPIVPSTSTCLEVSVSTSQATAMGINVPATVLVPALQVIKIQNQDSTVAIHCSDSVNVSSQTASANLGWKIVAGSSETWTIMSTQGWNCIAEAASAAIKTVVCMVR